MNRSRQILEVARTDLSEDICLHTYVNTTLDFSLFDNTSSDLNSTLYYGCGSSATPQLYQFSCLASRDGYFALDVDLASLIHEQRNFSVLVPISRSEAPGLPQPLEGGNDTAIIREVMNKSLGIIWIANTSQCENCNKLGVHAGEESQVGKSGRDSSMDPAKWIQVCNLDPSNLIHHSDWAESQGLDLLLLQMGHVVPMSDLVR
ncbi:hypothetical protein NL676_029359 [Syzygium grande]|nr:hypothetical protein NL676_029359 [Syzygium grande]